MWLVLGNSSARGGASSPVDELYGGVAVDAADTYTLNNVVQTTYASSGGAGVAPYLITKLHALGVANPEVYLWATSGDSVTNILDDRLDSAFAQATRLGIYPDAVLYLQATPNNTTAELLATFEEEFPLVLSALDSAWPGVPVYVASGTSDVPDDRPYWLELDQAKQSICAAEGCTYFDIQGIDLDNTEHPTGGVGGGFYTIVERLAEAW